MLSILQFMFHGFWISISSLFIIALVIDGFVKLYCRTWRYICILVRGYPKTPNMDADGDIILPVTHNK